MSLLALIVAIIALPAAILDLRVAGVLLTAAAALAVGGISRKKWPRLGAMALAVVIAGAGLATWEIAEFRRPPATGGPDPSAFDRPGEDREVWLPLTLQRGPVTRLALLEFEPDQDTVYTGFEPQWIERDGEQGMRIIAYRHDGHTDFYDDLALTPEPEEESKVTGKGRLHYRHTRIASPALERDSQGRARITARFTDVEGRAVEIDIRERSSRASTPLGLLAPIGLSSEQPSYFPLFLLHDFEFLRADSQLEVRIDGEPAELADFPVPVPMQGELRSFAKYTVDAEVQSLFPTDVEGLGRVRTTGDRHDAGGTAHLFDGDGLERIVNGRSEVEFGPPLDVTRAGEGRFTVTSHPEMGTISGPYRVTIDGELTHLEIDIDSVTPPRQRGLLYKLIINERTTFGTWPKDYHYEALIDRRGGAVEASWRNARQS